MAAIEIEGLHKAYRTRRGAVVALDGLDLTVPEGGVFGFLGANGAGKTTTIRALVGHLRARGSMRLLGRSVPAEQHLVVDLVGALVEAPSFFPNFSGRRNLALLARSRGFPLARVDDVLATVGLAERARSRYATYSLGMRQRLGVAAALLKDPALLILDEPANGLDPPGILEMRRLMRRLGEEGRTVFVSSHILSEVQQTCDQVAIIARGRCVATGTVQELLRTGPSRYRVRVPGHLDDAGRTLTAAGFPVLVDEHGELVVEVEEAQAAGVTRALAAAGLYLSELRPIERTLEDAFLALTADPGDSLDAAGETPR